MLRHFDLVCNRASFIAEIVEETAVKPVLIKDENQTNGA